MLPQSYRVQDGCHNCGLCFHMGEYDSESSVLCTSGAPERPICGSVAMGEAFATGLDGRYDGDLFDKRSKAWEEWSEGREVRFFGICDGWRKDND